MISKAYKTNMTPVLSYSNMLAYLFQVSHHPPISACHAEAERWKFWQGIAKQYLKVFSNYMFGRKLNF